MTTLMARGAFPDSHRQCLGMPGMHGNYTAITAMQEADLLIALGTRFDDRVTGRVSSFAPGAKVVHVDIDPAELGKIRRPDVPIVGDCRLVIEELVRVLVASGDVQPDRAPWWAQLTEWSSRFPLHYEPQAEGDPLKPQAVIEAIRDASPADTTVVSGVGQHQMWASQYWRFDYPYTWVNSGGLGTMGFAVPAAIGAKVGRPDRTVWAIDGDGCFQMTAQELVTASSERIPDKGGHPQQCLPRHGPPMAGNVLPGTLFRGVPLTRPPRLRQMGRSHGLRRLPGRAPLRRRSRDRQGQRHRRPPCGHRFPY